MAQGQAKRAKFKQLKESTRTMRLELEATEQKLEDLEEEIQRLDQAEKILCAEVQEAEDPQGVSAASEEESSTPKGTADTQKTGPTAGDLDTLIGQLQAALESAGGSPARRPARGRRTTRVPPWNIREIGSRTLEQGCETRGSHAHVWVDVSHRCHVHAARLVGSRVPVFGV